MQDARIGTFDGLDNRKCLFENLKRLGHGLDEYRAGLVRAHFLRSLLDEADPQWHGKTHRLRVDPCSAIEAYHLLVALMSGFGVPIETAAKRLETALRNPNWQLELLDRKWKRSPMDWRRDMNDDRRALVQRS